MDRSTFSGGVEVVAERRNSRSCMEPGSLQARANAGAPMKQTEGIVGGSGGDGDASTGVGSGASSERLEACAVTGDVLSGVTSGVRNEI